jgi:hypothetical protein
MDSTWLNCSSLTDFSEDVFANWNPSSLASGVFNNAWDGCSALTAQSVENILTAIDASGKYATANGASGGSALADAGIDIDYNTATGSLSAATNSAIDSLSGKGWEVFINGVLVIPNILDLAPAAAYSLRSFDADADPVVVNVRRSSDNASSDFKASEVSDGTLTTFCGPRTLDNNLTNWTAVSATTTSASITTSSTGGAYLSVGVGTSVRVQATGTRTGADVALWSYYGSSNSLITTLGSSFNIDETFTAASPMLFFRAVGVAEISFTSLVVTSISEDGHVTTWYDQGGTNHATQSTASSQPKIVDGGTLVTESGLPALDFDGVNDSFSIPAGMISNLDTLLVSAVLTNSDGGNDYGVVLGEPNNRIYVPYVNSSQLSIGYADSAVKLQDGAYSNGLQLITLSVDSSTASGFKNGQAFSTVATATASNNAPTVTTNANRIGTFGSQISGSIDFSEVVIFNTDQSANRTGIEANIMDTYSIS